MELIKFSKNDAPVMIDVIIEGTPVWSYIYMGDLTFKNKSSSGNNMNHILGLPINLDNDINSWDIRVGNMTKETVNARLTIRWQQSGKNLNTWIRDIAISAESARKISDDALLTATV